MIPRRTTAALLAAAFLSASSCTSTAPTAGDDPPPRPNFLVVVTDDQRTDALGCAGNPVLRTPQLDRLASEGTRFTRAYVTTPICAASRASILTGLYERTHGFTFGQPPLDERFVAESYPARLRDSGYRTGFVGKIGVRLAEGSAARMFDAYRPTKYPYFTEQRGDRHLTETNTDLAIEFLRECSAAEPFCLSISYNAPHAEDGNPEQYVWPASCDGLYEDAAIPPPATSDPAFFDALPAFLRESLNRERWHWRFDTPEKRQRMVKGYYRMIHGVDLALGRLRAELEALGLAENTVILAIGDNGYFLGERGFAGKWTMHELSIGVPLVVFDPRRPEGDRGRLADELVLNVDLAPTILDLAGAPAVGSMQGRSLRPLLEGGAVAWREEILTEHLWAHESIPRTEAIRTERWKYIRYLDHAEYEELYDLTNDPGEEVNLAGEERCAGELIDLRQRCTSLRPAAGFRTSSGPP